MISKLAARIDLIAPFCSRFAAWRTIFIGVSATFLAGCGAPTLQKWVENRGYRFDPNYSDLTLLGSQIIRTPQGAALVPYPNVSVRGQKGNITDFDVSKESRFSVHGAADVSKILAKLTDGHASGNFSDVASATFSVKSPYREIATTFVPERDCNGQKLIMAYDVLNTGRLDITLQDKHGGTIDAKAVLSDIDPKLGLSYESDTKSVETGNGMFVGYLPVSVSCTSTRMSVTADLGHGDNTVAYTQLGLFMSVSAIREIAKDRTYEAIIVLQGTPWSPVSTVAQIADTTARQGLQPTASARILSEALTAQVKYTDLAHERGHGGAVYSFPNVYMYERPEDSIPVKDAFTVVQTPRAYNGALTANQAAALRVKPGDVIRLGGGDDEPLYLILITQVARAAVTADVDAMVLARDSDSEYAAGEPMHVDARSRQGAAPTQR